VKPLGTHIALKNRPLAVNVAPGWRELGHGWVDRDSRPISALHQ